MWVVATYRATSLFSLKPAAATASGGRTLLVPTPYAVKMALLDVACRLVGQPAAAEAWDAWLGTCPVALRVPEAVVVNNVFIRYLRKKEFKSGNKKERIKQAKIEKQYPFYNTIAYREYAQLAGDLGVALQVETDAQAQQITRWFAHINYLGKRGSFMQLQHVPTTPDDLSEDWLVVGQPLEDGFALDRLLTQLDDVGEDATFEVVNIYNPNRYSTKVKLGKHRLLHHVALPYERVASSRGYTHYRRQPEADA